MNRHNFLFAAAIMILGSFGCREKSPAPTANNTGNNTAVSEAPSVVEPNEHLAKVGTRVVHLPAKPHWKQVPSPRFDTVYLGDPGDVYYATRHDDPNSLPPLDDIDAVRQFYREATKTEDGGILSVDFTTVQGHEAIVYYWKQTVKGINGYRYVAECVLPADDGWFEVRMDAIEMSGATGGREAVALMSLGGNIEYEDIPEASRTAPDPDSAVKPTGKRIKGYFFDPYDAKYNEGAINSIADDMKYDTAMPTHPLSRLRRTFPALLETLEITVD